MVRYVILRKILREVPPYISFRPTRLSAWIFAKGGHIHSVQTPDPATWSTPPTEFTNIVSLPSYPDANVSMTDALPANEGSSMESWSDDKPPHQPESDPCLIHDNLPGTRHTKTGIPSLSDTCPHTCMILNQNVNGLGSRDDKLERLIKMMINRKIHGYCLQETWQLGTYCKKIRGHNVFHHGVNDRHPGTQGRNSAGVMIILGHDLTRAWARAGKLTPLQSSPSSKFPGRIIGVTLSFLNISNHPKDLYHHKEKSSIKLFLCSIYHPHDHAEQTEFYDNLESFINSRPRKLELLIGADVNYNLGVRTPMF